MFDEYRVGVNESTWKSAGTDIAYILNDAAANVSNYRQAFDGDDLFSGSNNIFQGNFRDIEGQVVKPGFIPAMEYGLSKLSPVHPKPENKPIY